jgi:hypothetical protein
VKDEESRSIIIFSQDELAFHQFLLKSKNWTGPKGGCALLPKSDGMAVMVSAIISLDTGFGLKLDSTKLAERNYARQGKKYTNETAARDVLNCTEKQDLKESPFVKYFELGANNEGYWGYNHMVLQLEDCVDCLKVVYPHLDFVFLFDQSSGHSKKRCGGLDAGQMNSRFGGSQPLTQKSMIIHADGYLGPNDSILSVGMEQSMSFVATDVGPFWRTATEQNDRRLDQARTNAVAPKPRNKTEKDLAAELSIPGLALDPSKYPLDPIRGTLKLYINALTEFSSQPIQYKQWVLVARATLGQTVYGTLLENPPPPGDVIMETRNKELFHMLVMACMRGLKMHLLQVTYSVADDGHAAFNSIKEWNGSAATSWSIIHHFWTKVEVQCKHYRIQACKCLPDLLPEIGSQE